MRKRSHARFKPVLSIPLRLRAITSSLADPKPSSAEQRYLLMESCPPAP